jgi:hypothetical protein
MKGVPKLDPSTRTRVATLFKASWITLRPLTRGIAELARDVVWDSSIKPKDAVHVATAAMDRVSEMHSFDGDMTGKTLDVAGFVVNVTRPRGTGQQPLPLAP